jgi:hypothetical protein
MFIQKPLFTGFKSLNEHFTTKPSVILHPSANGQATAAAATQNP